MLNSVWRELAPAFAPLLAAAPVDVLGMLSNAAIHLNGVAGARPAQWQRELATLAPQDGKICLIIEDSLAKNWLQGQLKIHREKGPEEISI